MAHTTTAAAVDVLEEAVLALDGVSGLHAGSQGEIATPLPGRRVPGVRVRAGVVDVHVTLADGAPLRATAAAVRDVVAALLPGAVVDVTVEDLGPDAPPVRVRSGT